MGITKPTLIGYLRLFQDRGWTALTTCRVPPGPQCLGADEGVIVAAFARHPPATLVEARTRITELTGIERSPAQVGKVLKQFGLRRRKTRAMPGPAPTDERRAEQATFEAAALAPRLREAQTGQRAVFFWTPPTSSTAFS